MARRKTVSQEKIGDYKIPFDVSGNMLSYAYTLNNTHAVDNFVFEDTLEYEGFYRGRSAAKFRFKRKSNGARVEMFMSEMDATIKAGKLVGKEITGRFTFIKRGSNYGVKPLEDVDDGI